MMQDILESLVLIWAEKFVFDKINFQDHVNMFKDNIDECIYKYINVLNKVNIYIIKNVY